MLAHLPAYVHLLFVTNDIYSIRHSNLCLIEKTTMFGVPLFMEGGKKKEKKRNTNEREEKQGRIHGNPVANDWAAAIHKKS